MDGHQGVQELMGVKGGSSGVSVLPDSRHMKFTRAAPTMTAGSQALGYSRGARKCLPGVL